MSHLGSENLQQQHQQQHRRLSTNSKRMAAAAAAAATDSLDRKDVRACAVLQKGRKIYVRNLPHDVQHDALSETVRKACEQSFGEVDYVRVAHGGDDRKRRNKSRDKSKLNEGFCFVRFKEEAAAEKALKALSVEGEVKDAGLFFEGMPPLQVEWAREVHTEDVDQSLLQAARAEKRKLQEHKKRQRKRNKEKEIEEIQTIIEKLPEPAGMDVLSLFKDLGDEGILSTAAAVDSRCNEGKRALDPKTLKIDWSQIPVECNPGEVAWYNSTNLKHVDRRRRRKMNQVQSFALVLAALEGAIKKRQKEGDPPIQVVDFGSSTGALILPLAYLFPHFSFHAVDMKPKSVEMLLDKASKGGLQNVTAEAVMIEQFEGKFDIALALHACGNATDYSILQAVKNRAAFVVCPCCVGKLKFSIEGGSSFHRVYTLWPGLSDQTNGNSNGNESPGEGLGAVEHPRSQWMRGKISKDEFGVLAKSGDISQMQGHGYAKICELSKANLEFDRAAAARESKYSTGMYRLIDGKDDPKSQLIVGAPEEYSITF